MVASRHDGRLLDQRELVFYTGARQSNEVGSGVTTHTNAVPFASMQVSLSNVHRGGWNNRRDQSRYQLPAIGAHKGGMQDGSYMANASFHANPAVSQPLFPRLVADKDRSSWAKTEDG